jgi:hypothetical protein
VVALDCQQRGVLAIRPRIWLQRELVVAGHRAQPALQVVEDLTGEKFPFFYFL